MKTNYDVIIVGGGPAGSIAGKMIAESSVSVCILEKDRDIGYPVRCGEAVSEGGLRQFVEPRDSWIATKISEFRLISPNGTKIDAHLTSQQGFILNRRIFDYDLAQIASDKGTEIYTKAYVSDLIVENNKICGVKVEHFGEEKDIRAKLVIGADGVESRIGRWAGLRTQLKMKDIESCVQYTVANVDVHPNRIDFYMGETYSPGGYLWVFPKGNGMANIGLGISGKFNGQKSAKKWLDEFMDREYPNASILTTVCGGVPCAKPMKNPITDNLMLIGDAAHFVNPMTGGGIISAMKSGWIAGQVASESIKKNDTSAEQLQKYAKEVKKAFGDNHKRFYRIKETISEFSDADLNGIAEKIAKIPVGNRTLTKIFKAAVPKKPSLILDVVKVFTGI